MKLEDNPTSKQNKIKIMQQFNHPYYEKNRKTLCKVCKKNITWAKKYKNQGGKQHYGTSNVERSIPSHYILKYKIRLWEVYQ